MPPGGIVRWVMRGAMPDHTTTEQNGLWNSGAVFTANGAAAPGPAVRGSGAGLECAPGPPMRIENPARASHRYTQRLEAPPERVFPLLCPVREVEWAEGWNPTLVLSGSGVAEPGCVFTTAENGREAIWTFTDYDPSGLMVRFVKVVPALYLLAAEIRLEAAGAGRSRAHVAYTYTALSRDGEDFVAERSAEWWETFMREWEDSLNAYLSRS